MKKIFLLAGIFALLSTITIKAQVKIGDLTPPDSSAVLQVVSTDSTKGVLVPEMTEDKRDLIHNPADGLLIYNITEECFNYWNAADSAWQSLCGGLAKATYEVACSDISVNGTYVQGTALNGNNYLSMLVNVIKPGTYSITGTTTNGYGFNTSGTFLNAGMQTVTVPGQGQPVATKTAPKDTVRLSLTGLDSGCNEILIPVLSPSANYSLNCGSAVFNGAYVKNTALTASNTVTLSVNVTDISSGGTWAVTTGAPVNGISFSGSGTFPSTGNQTITLQGTGTPTTTDPITLTFTTNSGDGAATCQATVNMAYSNMTIAGFDGADLNYGYDLYSGAVSRNMLTASQTNFGTQATSMVKSSGFTVNATMANNPSDITFHNALAAKPDIVVIGYSFPWTTAKNTDLQNYLIAKGVVILMDENNNGGLQNFLRTLYANPSITVVNAAYDQVGGDPYGPFTLSSLTNDPILAGPFQPSGYTSLAGLGWGNDVGTGCVITAGLPSNLITYSTGLTTNTAAGVPGVTMFRDPNLNLFWVADGGFDSNLDGTAGVYGASATICPFAINNTANSVNIGGVTYPPYAPIPRTGWYGAPTTTTVYNSYVFANVMAWALNQAQFNGINSSLK